MNQRLSILVEEDEILPAPQAAGGALQSGLLALGTVMPQTLALVGIAYAPLVLLGVQVNPLWVIWSAVAGIALMFVLTRQRGVIYGVRPGAALLYASTLTTCASLAPSLQLQAMGVFGLAAATMTFAAIVMLLALATGFTRFSRYLPAPVGRGLSLGFGLTILWVQAKTIFGWFVDAKGHAQLPAAAAISLVIVVLMVMLVLQLRAKHPARPYLLLLLPIAGAIVWAMEFVLSVPLGWISAPVIKAPMDLLPIALPQAFAADVLHGVPVSVWWSAITLLAAQAVFVAFTFLVDAAGNAANIENLTGDSYDLGEELRASAATMAVLPWFGLLPASSMVAATRPLYDSGIRNGRSIRLGNLVVVLGMAALLGLVWLGLGRLPVLFVVAALIVIGIQLLDTSLFSRAGKGTGEREMWAQTWLIGLVFLFAGGIFAMLAGFAVAFAQLVRGAEGTVIRSTFTLQEIRSRRWRSDEEESILKRCASGASGSPAA